MRSNFAWGRGFAMDENVSAKEIKPSFSWRYFVLTSISALIPLSIGGVGGYFFHDYTRDKKIVEVLSTSSGNLASLPVGAIGNLKIVYPVADGTTQEMKSLIRYDVKITNKTEQGVDDFSVFIETPHDVEVPGEPTITTEPPEVLGTISVTKSTNEKGRVFKVSLLNPGQNFDIQFFDISKKEAVSESRVPTVIIAKKDWMQRNVQVGVVSEDQNNSWPPWILTAALGGLLITLLFLFDAVREYRSSARAMNDWRASVTERPRAARKKT